MTRYLIEVSGGRIRIRALTGGNLIALGFGELIAWEADFSLTEPDAVANLLRDELWEAATAETVRMEEEVRTH